MPITPFNQNTGKARGFTLVELLLAMALSALVGTLAFGGLSSAVTAVRGQAERGERLADLQLSLDLMERDLRQLAQREIRAEGGSVQPSLEGGTAAGVLLRLTRRGWSNARGLPRSELQRVRYRIEDGALWRDHWPRLDRVTARDGLQSVRLLDRLEAARLEFLEAPTSPGDWHAAALPWRPYWHSGQAYPGPERGERFPAAVRVSLTVRDFGEVERVFELL